MLRIISHLRQRHLMRAPRALDRDAVDFFRSGPPLRCAQHDHWPARTRLITVSARAALHGADPVERFVDRRRELLMHVWRLVALDQERFPAISLQQCGQLFVGDPGEHRRVRDLVVVEMKDREHGSVPDGVEELVRMPARRERTRFGFSISHDARHDQVGVVERGTEGVADRVPELAALVDGTRSLRSDVTGHSTGEGELAEQALHALAVSASPTSTSRYRRLRARRSRGSRDHRARDR